MKRKGFIQMTPSNLKRPWDVWLRVALGIILARFWPTTFDPLFRGRPSWRLAFKMVAKSWGYEVRE